MTLMTRTAVLVAVIAAVVALVGCGGGGSPSGNQGPPTGKGIVRGQVKYFDQPDLPVTGVQVHVGDTVVETQNSWFEATVDPGEYDIWVEPPEGYVVASNAHVQVQVAAGQTVVLDAPFLLIDENDQPPAP